MGNEDIKVIADRQELVDIADAVREKTGNGKSMGIGEIVRNIRNMSSGTVNNQSKTVSPTEQQQVVSPDSGYNGLSSVTVNAIASDYVGSNVPREDAKTITPTKSSQVAVSGGTYVDGDISVGAIPDEYITTTDADAIAEEIALNKTAYVDGKKVTGSFTIENEVSSQEDIISTQDEMIANIVSALEGKAAGGSGEISVITTTISEEQANWVDTLTIPELVGAKYFIIQSPYMGSFFNIDQIEDAGKIYSLIYLNGEIFSLAMFKLTMGSYGGVESIDTSTWSFDDATGTIITDQEFGKVSIDTSTNIAYKVYRLG